MRLFVVVNQSIAGVYKTLMELVNTDPHVMFSSRHEEPPALHALIAWGKDPIFTKRIIALLLVDVAGGQPTCHWSHLQGQRQAWKDCVSTHAGD